MQDTTVAVLGQGPMGAAISQALLRAGTHVIVWNRTPERCEPQAAAGAQVAAGPDEAVRAADLTISVLRDVDATLDVLSSVPSGDVMHRSVLNLASGTPEDARRAARWAAGAGVPWLSGAVMVPTPLIGSADALLLFSGDRDLFDAHLGLLRAIGGDVRYVGDDHGHASLLDTGMLEIFFAGMTAFLHAAAMVTAQGVSATEFLPLATVMVDILPATLDGLARDVDAGAYPGTEDRLAMDLAAMEHVVATSDEVGLDGRLPRLLRDLGAAAVAEGHGDDGWSRVVEELRKP